MNAHALSEPLSGHDEADNCCPASSCWELAIRNSSVKTASATAASAILRNRSPLGLSLCAAETTRAPPVQNGAAPLDSYLLDGLLREITHRKTEFRHRLIPWIKWQIPHHLLDSTDTTQLMYFIGRQFQLSDPRSSFYCVTFKLHEMDAERLALFKGLGFNAIEIAIPSTEGLDTQALAYCASLAEDFHFQHVGIELQSSSPNLHEALLNMLSSRGNPLGHRQPASITFKPADPESRSASAQLQTLYWGLTSRGYSVLGNDVYVRPETPLALAQKHGLLYHNLQDYNYLQISDVLGLGPGNTSAIGPIRATNPQALSQYLADSFDRYRVEAVDPRIKHLINQLLCYHQLNLLYFREQHQLDIEYLFSQLEHVCGSHRLDARHPLYQLQNHTLTLTAAGVLQLSSICRALNRLFPR